MAEPTKTCSKCGEVKPLDDFYKNKANKDGASCWCKTCKNEYSKQYFRENPNKIRHIKKKYHHSLKKKVLSILGDSCECCGTNIYEFLTVDHINNDGYKERNSNTGSRGIYRKVIKLYEENPDEVFKRYRILCFNCNIGRTFTENGICPHKNLK